MVFRIYTDIGVYITLCLEEITVAEVNEEILEQYLKVVKRWFYIGDIPFTVPHNYSNIDVLGYDPITDQYYDFEVKFRSAFSLTNDGEAIRYLVDQFEKYREQREAKLSQLIARPKTIKFVVKKLNNKGAL